MDQAYKERNMKDCELKIDNCERRLKFVKYSNEDADWLQSELDGFKATLKKLTETEID